MHRKTRIAITTAAASIAAGVCAQAAHGSVVFTDASAFDSALRRVHTESFENLGRRRNPKWLRFDGELTVTLDASGTKENRIERVSDGFGAVAADGQGFWKLRGGSVTLTASGPEVNAFGFFYSDLERATLRISAPNGAIDPILLTDDNPNANRFFGVIAGAPLDDIRIEWMSNEGDGVGIDAMRFGSTAAGVVVPAPRSITLGLAGLLLLALPQRRAQAG